MSLYDDPALYDALHTRGTAQELDGVERIARRHLPAPLDAPLDTPRKARDGRERPDGRDGRVEPHGRERRRPLSVPTWLEPACGSGRFLRLAARRGRRVIGFDLHPAMVAYAREGLRARRLAGRARVFVADMTDFAAHVPRGSVDVAFNLINSIRHLESDSRLLAHLRQVARVLRPRGIYVVGLSLTRYGTDAPEEDVWEATRGRLRLQQWLQYLPPGTAEAAAPREEPAPGRGRAPGRMARRECVISHVIATRGGRTEHHDASWWLRCYDARQWRAVVARSPLGIVEVCDAHGDPVDDWRGPYLVFVLGRTR